MRLIIVDCGAPRWTAAIAERLAGSVAFSVEEREGFGDRAKERGDDLSGERSRRGGAAVSTPHAWLVIAKAEPEAIRRAAHLWCTEILDQRAELILVDCQLSNLPAVCDAVRALPRWPVAWLGPMDESATPWRELAGRIARRLGDATIQLLGAGV